MHVWRHHRVAGAQQNNKLNVNVLVFVYGPFLTYEWAVLDVAVGRFRPGYGPFLPFAWAVLVHGPCWYRPGEPGFLI